MSGELVARLRNETDDFGIFNLVLEAADEIERLQHLLAQLSEFGTCYSCSEYGQYGEYSHFVRIGVSVLCPWRIAKAKAVQAHVG